MWIESETWLCWSCVQWQFHGELKWAQTQTVEWSSNAEGLEFDMAAGNSWQQGARKRGSSWAAWQQLGNRAPIGARRYDVSLTQW